MWYIVWRCLAKGHPYYGRIAGFITEEDGETPVAFDTEEEAQEAMSENILEMASEVIEL